MSEGGCCSAHPLPASKKERRVLLLEALAVFFAALLLYGLTHDRVYQNDAVRYGGMIEQPLFLQGGPSVVFGVHSFIWAPVARGFYLAARAVGFSWRGYEALQWLNTIIAGLILALTFVLLRKETSRSWAMLWTAFIGVSHLFWYRAAGGEYHLFATLWLVPLCWCARSFLLFPDVKPVIGMSLSALLATYSHISHGVVWAAPFLFILTQWNKKSWIYLSVGAAVFIAMTIPYGIVHELFKPGGYKNWWQWGTALSEGFNPNLVPGGAFSLKIFRNIPDSLQSFLFSFVSKEGFRWGGFAAFVAAAVSLVFGLKGRVGADRLLVNGLAFGIPGVIFLLMFTLWMPGHYLYLTMQPVLVLSFLGLVLYKPGASFAPLARAALLSSVLILGANNMHASVLVRREGSGPRPQVEFSVLIGKVTTPASLVVISGTESSDMKVYLPYFARRNRLAVELFCINAFGKPERAVDIMLQVIRKQMAGGTPVYMTQDVMRAAPALSQWAVSPDELKRLWESFDLIPVIDFNQGMSNALYLLYSDQMPFEMKERYCAALAAHRLWPQLAQIYRRRLKLEKSPDIRQKALELEKLSKTS